MAQREPYEPGLNIRVRLTRAIGLQAKGTLGTLHTRIGRSFMVKLDTMSNSIGVSEEEIERV